MQMGNFKLFTMCVVIMPHSSHVEVVRRLASNALITIIICILRLLTSEGWTYGLDGTLLKATRISGIKNFNKNDFGLLPIKVATWGPFVLARFDDSSQDTVGDVVGDEWLGSGSDLLSRSGINTSLPHICRREYIIECNWKVFCDNYLDGGYHVPYAHGALASGLQLQSYETLTYERVSVQRCESAPAEQEDIDRLGTKATYAFVYPNFMINRYGPWMDTNLAVPLDATRCKVVFDYFLDESLLVYILLISYTHFMPFQYILICTAHILSHLSDMPWCLLLFIIYTQLARCIIAMVV
ncbi:hypothetical protein ACQJBY_066023 [Aegilops geniculata]